jgi:hypothetical protein
VVTDKFVALNRIIISSAKPYSMTNQFINLNVLISRQLIRAFFILALLVSAIPATAQVTPADTTKAKPQLQTGPPEQENPEYHPPVIVAPAPRKTEEPEVKKKEKKVKVKEEPDYRRLFINSNAELYFGNVTYLNLTPALGYRLTRNFAIGPGIKYEFISYYGRQYHNYGGKLFMQYLIRDFVFVHSELEVLNVQDSEYVNNIRVRDFRRTITMFLIGAGYRQHISERFSADMMLLLNLNDNIYSPYRNPIIRVGFNIDLGR